MKLLISGFEYLLIALLGAITLITGMQIAGRYFFGFSPAWSETSVLLLLNYLIFLSAPVLLWRREHIGFDVFLSQLPIRLQKLSAALQELIIALFGAFACFYSYGLLMKVKSHQVATLGISQSLTYVPILLFGLMVFGISLYRLVRGPWKF